MFRTTGAASPPTPGALPRVGNDSGPAAPASIEEAHRSAANAAGWVGQNWSELVGTGLRILLIFAIAALLRFLIRRSISKLIERMNRRSEVADSGKALRGLLVSGERRRQRSAAIGSVLRSCASVVIMGTAVLMVLSGLGINLAPLLASAGVAGVALGFGARNLVQDVLAGMFMLLEDQYGVGDRVDVGEASGTVLEVGLRITQLRGGHGEIWYIRNGEIKRVGNLSQGWATAVLDVQLHPGEDLDAVRSAISGASEEMAQSTPWDELLWEPVEVLGLDSVTLESMVVRVSAKTMPGKETSVERELRWRIKRALDKLGIESVEEVPQRPGESGEDEAADSGTGIGTGSGTGSGIGTGTGVSSGGGERPGAPAGAGHPDGKGGISTGSVPLQKARK